MLDTFNAWLAAHPLIASSVFWPAVTAIVTLVFHWLDLAGAPIVGKINVVLKIIGVDGPKVISWLQSLFTPKPPSNPPAVVLPGAIKSIGGLGATLALALCLSGCVDGRPSQGAVEAGNAALTVSQVLCIIGHVAEPSSDAVAEACAIESALVPAIEKVLSGQKAAMARAMCSPADAGPGK